MLDHLGRVAEIRSNMIRPAVVMDEYHDIWEVIVMVKDVCQVDIGFVARILLSVISCSRVIDDIDDLVPAST